MSVIVSCHCGNTRIALPAHPTETMRCNCTFCRRTGAVWVYYAIGEIEVLQSEGQKDYSTDFKLGAHHFCGKCGMHTWGESIDWSDIYNDDGTPKQVEGGSPAMTKCQINLNLVDDLDWSKVNVEPLDGLNGW